MLDPLHNAMACRQLTPQEYQGLTAGQRKKGFAKESACNCVTCGVCYWNWDSVTRTWGSIVPCNSGCTCPYPSFDGPGPGIQIPTPTPEDPNLTWFLPTATSIDCEPTPQCPADYYPVGERCCSTQDCRGFMFMVNVDAQTPGGYQGCSEQLPPGLKIMNGNQTGFTFSCEPQFHWLPGYAQYASEAYPTIQDCNQKLTEVQAWFATNPPNLCQDRIFYGCTDEWSGPGGYLLDDGIVLPATPPAEQLAVWCP